jgi:hypothetical protein
MAPRHLRAMALPSLMSNPFRLIDFPRFRRTENLQAGGFRRVMLFQ